MDSKKVQNFSHFFDEPFLVICGDALIDLDLAWVMAFHKSHKGKATVVCKEVPKEDVYKYGVVVSDEDNKITSFQEKPSIQEAKSNMINTGIYIFDPCILDFIPEGSFFDIGAELLPLLIETNVDFYATVPEFQWTDVGSTVDFYETNIKVLEGHIKNVIPYGKEVKPKVWIGINCKIDYDEIEIVGPVYIGNSVKIDKGVKIIGPCVIGSNSIIKEDVTLKGVIVLDHTLIKNKVSLNTRIVSHHFLCNPYGKFLDVEEYHLHFMIDDARKYNLESSHENQYLIDNI
ncbi:MAG: NDP-sugar synthase [Sulfurovum sp.]|nr:NDP-sugar synthase [Sulfurovum sp.]